MMPQPRVKRSPGIWVLLEVEVETKLEDRWMTHAEPYTGLPILRALSSVTSTPSSNNAYTGGARIDHCGIAQLLGERAGFWNC